MGSRYVKRLENMSKEINENINFVSRVKGFHSYGADEKLIDCPHVWQQWNQVVAYVPKSIPCPCMIHTVYPSKISI